MGFVSSFIGVWFALAVISNTLALSATVTTVAQIVISVPQGVVIPSTNNPCLLKEKLPTPVRADRLILLLDGYDPSIVKCLRRGFTEGFSIHFDGDLPAIFSKNLITAIQQPPVVEAKLFKKIEAGRIAGPFECPPFQEFRISPLGVVPKKVPGEFRLIHHLSYPKGLSVNDGISPEYSSVTYANIEDAIRCIKHAGNSCFLAKTDITSAFRIIPIKHKDYHLLGMKWNGFYFYDRCMPMGCSSSCRTFEILSTAVEWIARHKLSIEFILHLLDDFLFIAPSYEVCSQSLDLFLSLCSYLGIPMAPEKTVGPSTTLSFVGIELDSISMEARLPHDKIQKCTTFISHFLRRKKVTLKELQSLIGLLNFACAVVRPGRAFLRRLIDRTFRPSPYSPIR